MTTRPVLTAALIATASILFLAGCAAGPAPTGTPTASPTATGTATGSPAATGCAPNSEAMPSGAMSAEIGDIDGDGKPDTEWYAETPSFAYGVTTASGATFVIPDTMAGPGRHSGWAATGLENDQVLTVVDDGRGAQLYAFVKCAFVTPMGADGKAYTFDMENLRGNGTGVWCTGGELDGVQALLATDGTYTITVTPILVSADGKTATNGETSQLSAVPADDPRVADAQRSTCGETPIVSTSGM